MKRLRMFAGPNGSGKTTLAKNLHNQGLFHLGYFINADEIEENLKRRSLINFDDYGIVTTHQELVSFFKASQRETVSEYVQSVKLYKNILVFNGTHVNSYVAALIADFLREKLLATGINFSFETVMSHPSKIEILKKAQQLGYRTYLYFITTETPVINKSRVEARVLKGGHPVPAEKIEKRFGRSLELLKEAIAYSDRAFLFDNSTQEHIWIAEITHGRNVELKSEYIPNWFIQYVETY